MRKIKTIKSKSYADQIAIIRKSEDGEFIVSFYKNGVDLGEGPRYYAGDKQDAIDTATSELEREWSAPTFEKIYAEVKEEISDELAQDVLNIAMEGGVNYWAEVTAIANTHGELGEEWGTVELRDAEDENSPVYTVDRETIKRGIAHIFTTKEFCRSDIADSIRKMIFNNDACEIDAEGADVIVQAALFKNVTYG